MGYTHYFPQQRDFTEEEWNTITHDVSAILKYTDTALAYESDTDLPPLINDYQIRFNGKGDKGHETFILTREKTQDFQFCKTARKPYDIIVCAVLIIADHHAPGALEVRSDGDSADWKPAHELVHGVLIRA